MKDRSYRWLLPCLRDVIIRNSTGRVNSEGFLFFCIADHFEPVGVYKDKTAAYKFCKRFIERLPEIYSKFFDSAGTNPVHTFFYPVEEYDDSCIELIVELCRQGFGELEIQLHHRNDTRENLIRTLKEYVLRLRERYGVFGSDRSGMIRFGFVHGNWALCNSRKDADWCGVNEELGALAESGCYADFTFPSAPSSTQPLTVNRIYYASDRKDLPRGADYGIPLKVGGKKSGDLLIIPGVLCFDFSRRKYGFIPRIENSEVEYHHPPSKERIRLWVKYAPSVTGRNDWLFIKIHTHGAREENWETFYRSGGISLMFDFLCSEYNDGRRWKLFFVTGRQMYNIIKSAENGEVFSIKLKDYEIFPPPY